MYRINSTEPADLTTTLRHLLLALFALGLFSMAGASVAAGRVFYDGFESGNTNLWGPDDYRNRCQVVTTSADGVAGPFAGSRMVRCNDNGVVAWNDPASFENLMLSNISYSQELFIRTRVRVDQNLPRTASSAKKILRIFNWNGMTSQYNDIYDVVFTSPGFRNEGTAGGTAFSTYWGGTANDHTGSSSAWHKIEYYINTSGAMKVWHDGVLVRDDVGLPMSNAKWMPFTIASNWSDPHGATNYVYFDEFEVFTDTGTGASGTMSNATISAVGSPPSPPPVIAPPPNLRVI